MAGGIELIAPIEPKNNGSFPMVYGKDVEIDGKRLPQLLEEAAAGVDLTTATPEDIDSLFTEE